MLWRWAFGIPALLLVYWSGSRVLAAVPWRTTGIEAVTVNQLLTDPLRASVALADFGGLVLPAMAHTALWLGALLLAAWILLSTLGRMVLLRRMDRRLKGSLGTLLLLQAIRLLPLFAIAAAWWFGLQALARKVILDPISNGGEPQMMVYVGGAIVLSLGLFVLAGAIGWIFSAAPILSMRDGTGALPSLRAVWHLGHRRSSLLEINMVLSVVKIMLLVLAMAFSAFPLPFANVITQQYILFWSAFIGVFYFIGSDFFHVARLAGTLRLLEASPGAL